MIALQITSMKQFMNRLLAADTFHAFLLEGASITTANTVTIDGHLNKAFFSEQELESGQVPDYEYTPWQDMKGLCFQLIKGKNTPLAFKFVLHLKPEHTKELLQKGNCSVDASLLKALVLTIRYDGTKAVLTTGCAYQTFVMSKEAEQIWDNAIQKYLSGNGVSFELL